MGSGNGQSVQAAATVPGTIHTALLVAKIIDESYWGFGDMAMRNLVYQSWTYTKKFSPQQDFLHLTEFQLHLTNVFLAIQVVCSLRIHIQSTKQLLPPK